MGKQPPRVYMTKRLANEDELWIWAEQAPLDEVCAHLKRLLHSMTDEERGLLLKSKRFMRWVNKHADELDKWGEGQHRARYEETNMTTFKIELRGELYTVTVDPDSTLPYTIEFTVSLANGERSCEHLSCDSFERLMGAMEPRLKPVMDRVEQDRAHRMKDYYSKRFP